MARAGGIDPAWLKAPFLLVRFPSIFFSIVVASLILGATTATAPVLLSSAGNAALAQELQQTGELAAGLSFSAFGLLQEQTFTPADELVTEKGASLVGAGGHTLMVEAASTRIQNAAGQESAVRFLHRTGAVDNIRKLTPDTGGPGVWMSDLNARELSVGPGDTVFLKRAGLTKPIEIAGIYKNLASEAISAHWSPITFRIVNSIPNQPPLYPFLIMDMDTLLELGGGTGQQATFSWDFPLDLETPTMPEVEAVADSFMSSKLEASDRSTDLGRAMDRLNQFGGADITTSLPSIISNSEKTVAAIEGPVRLISLAGRLVALAVIAAAGMFAHTKRRVEARLLSAQGRTPLWQGAKAAVEAILPAAIGGALGWVAGVAIVRSVGPSELVSAGVPQTALKEVVWWLALAVLMLGAVFAVAAHQESQLGASRLRQAVGRVPWEVIVLALAGASLYEVLAREDAIVTAPDQPPSIDLLLLAFPFLFIAGMAGLATRAIRRLLPRIRRSAEHAPPWRYLAVRRFAGAQKIALVLITSSAIALGILFYSATLVATTSRTVAAKAQILAGSDLAAGIQRTEDSADDLPFPRTHVAITSGDLLPVDVRVNILAIDAETFEQGAYWDSRFAARPLDELLAELRSGSSRVPVILAGAESPDQGTVEARGLDIPIEVVERVEAWPGMVPNRGLMVVDSETYTRVVQNIGGPASDPFAVNEIWAKGDPEQLLAELNEHEVLVTHHRAAADVQDAPTLRSLSWTFGFLQALGSLAGSIALVGIILYLQSRQQAREVSYALARRMGLSRGSHRLAVGLELVAMMGTAVLVGGLLALIAAYLVIRQIDPLPGLPPTPLFDVPGYLLWGAPLVLAIVSVLGAWRVQRRADHMNVAEVMRLAG